MPGRNLLPLAAELAFEAAALRQAGVSRVLRYIQQYISMAAIRPIVQELS
jgi:hypothetical protein